MTTHEGYKWFIDQLVSLSGNDVLAKRISQNGHPIRTNEEDLPLTEEEQTRKDVFSSMTVKGEALQESPFAFFHYDFTCRNEGAEWP